MLTTALKQMGLRVLQLNLVGLKTFQVCVCVCLSLYITAHYVWKLSPVLRGSMLVVGSVPPVPRISISPAQEACTRKAACVVLDEDDQPQAAGNLRITSVLTQKKVMSCTRNVSMGQLLFFYQVNWYLACTARLQIFLSPRFTIPTS